MLSPAELAARKAAFVARNPGAWSVVTFGSDGLVFHLETHDPSITVPDARHPDGFSDADLAHWVAFLRRNAGFFGIADPASVRLVRVPLAAQPTPNVAELRQYVGKTLLAEISVAKRPGGGIAIDGALEPIAVKATVDDAALIARVVGGRYLERTTWYRAATRDCGMTPRGARSACAATPIDTVTATRTADRASVYVIHAFKTIARGRGWFEKRYIACVNVRVQPVPLHSLAVREPDVQANSTLTPLRGAAPVPLAVDIVTGETLAGVCPK